jgi:hypothetical protein
MVVRSWQGTVAALALAVAAATAGRDLRNPLYKDASMPISVRVTDLVKRMTLEEKVNQTLNDYFAGAFGPGADGVRSGCGDQLLGQLACKRDCFQP